MALTDALQVTTIAYPTIFLVMAVFYGLIKLMGALMPGEKS